MTGMSWYRLPLRKMTKLPYYNSFFKTSNQPVALLSEKLAQITPDGLNHVLYANSGSEQMTRLSVLCGISGD